MSDPSKKNPAAPEQVPEAERRRIGTIVHDERGNASVHWRDAPGDIERPVLEVLGDPGLTLKPEEAFDPYARGAGRGVARKSSGNTTRTDLRKLSEWIKMMRELEERKRNGGGDSSGGAAGDGSEE
ncbi:MAG TPA: hypothetical protein VK803_10465 [Steroidobacteraceae bacterium]|nr:hypothetical protein [Steroidobacteraceae bacterium]